MLSFTVLSILLLGRASATPFTKRIPEKFSMAAFGDSFSAGIGDGRFFQGSADERDNICARMTGAYPVHLQSLFPTQPSLDFLSCSGDILDDIDGQVAALLGNTIDLATLSISGNDFNFGKVVGSCVYPKRTDYGSQSVAQAACSANLTIADNSISDDSIFDKYVSKVRLIKDKLNTGGVLYITGYAKFFSTDGSAGDKCDKTSFFNSFWIRQLVGVLPMLIQNRERMNDLVDRVNARIQQDVVDALKNELNIVWIDIDSHFDNRRFCEPGQDIWGSDDPRVQFNDLFTTQVETDDWDGPAHPDRFWTPDFNDPGLSDPGFVGRGIQDELQQNSVFHPKELAHTITAAKIFLDASGRIGQGFKTGPDQICKGFSPGGGDTCFDIPQGCVGADTPDNTDPVIVCPGGNITSGDDLPLSATQDNPGPLPLKGNSAGTNIHVNKGCIYINDSQRCEGGDAYNVAFQNDEVSRATILAKLPSDTTDKQVTAGCELDLFFPYYYGDVFFGEDNCVYDASGNQVASQCCNDATDKQVDNPYFSG